MFNERNEVLVLGLISVLAVAIVAADIQEPQDHSRSRRQVTYLKRLNESKEDSTDSDHDFHYPVTRRPLPSQLAYPGDLSRFFTTGYTGTQDPHAEGKADNTTTRTLSTEKGALRREKRGGYVLEKKEENYSLGHGSESELLLSAASTRSGRVQEAAASGRVVPSEMVFDGAGFLRVEEDPGLEQVYFQPTNIRKQRVHSGPNSNSYALPSRNSQAINDFRAAFNPSIPRTTGADRYHEGSNYNDKEQIKFRQEGEVISKSSEVLRIINNLKSHNRARNHPTGALSKRRTIVKVVRQNNPTGGNPPFLLNSPQRSVDHSAANLPHQTEESFINYHTLQPFQVEPKLPLPRQFFLYPNQLLSRRVSRTKRSTSTYHTPSHNPVKATKDTEFEATSQESRKKYRLDAGKDQQRADSGFIPITGSYDGGVIHLSLPYYGSPSPPPPSYGSPSPVHVIHTYPSSPPSELQSRHYGSSGPAEHYFHPSEARRYSYGVLGSGNFEVIRGGIFPDNEHGGGGGYHGGGSGSHGYHSGRTPYSGNSYSNNYGGTTEIIFDGPIQGFQGFDNFPAHLINALSKHADVTVHGPPERRQEESQFIPVSYPLQAVS